MKTLSRFCKYLFGTLLLTVANSAIAQQASSSNCGTDSIFSPTCTDKSIEYLSRIFGKVGGVLSGAEGTLLQELFSIFNSVVLGLGAIVIMYTLFVGTLKTAHEGQALGEKWSSIWIPIRSALGVILIVPAKASGGYSFIQVFFMWIVIQGVGAADTLWTRVLEGLTEQRPLIPQAMLTNTTGFRTAFRGLSCMYALNKVEDPTGLPTYEPIESGDSFIFRAGPYGDVCGSISVDSSGDVVGRARVGAMKEAVGVMQEAAIAIAYDTGPPPANAIGNAIVAYRDAVSSRIIEFKAKDGAGKDMGEARERAKAVGWIFAGSYYYDIARIQDRISIQTFAGPTAQESSNLLMGNDAVFAPPDPQDKRAIFVGTMAKANQYMSANIDVSAASQAQQAGRVGVSGFSSPSGLSGTGGTPVGDITEEIYYSLNSVLQYFMKHVSGQDPETGKQINPMFAMQSFGLVLLAIVEGIWITVTTILGVLILAAVGGGAAAAAASAFGVDFGPMMITTAITILTFVSWIMSWLGPILLFMFTVGGILSHYIPMIPFFYFTFAAIGWLMLVFEAIVVAPIVALGILHPEGGDVFGKGEHAIMLLTNVFLTPSLLIFGMIGAMMLSYVVVGMVNFGFYNTLSTFSGVGDSSATGQFVLAIASITVFVAFIVLYCGTIMFTVQKAFSLIPELRTKVLTWIGGQASSFGEDRLLDQVKGQHEAGMGAMGKGSQAAAESASKATKEGATKKLGAAKAPKTGGVAGKPRGGGGNV